MSVLLDSLTALADSVGGIAVLADGFDFDTDPTLPEFETEENPLEMIFNWGQGIVVVIGIIGVLFAAGKMAVGKFGRSDLAADGVGSLVWVVFGISLMLIAIPLILAIGGVDSPEETEEDDGSSAPAVYDMEDTRGDPV